MNNLLSTALLAACVTAQDGEWEDNGPEVLTTEDLAKAPGKKRFSRWVRCATEGETCNCEKGGKIAYGDPEWMNGRGRKTNEGKDGLVIKKNASKL